MDYRSKKEVEYHITLKSLEENITKFKEPDDHFIRQFMLCTIGTVLAPTTKHRVDSKYLAVVENVKENPKYNWGNFTLTNLLGCINSFKAANQVNLKFNFASSK
jgi:hypothetical protein